eukprot:SAG11_NODE_1010_length_6199_cov_2.572131_6_plen_83_part_00
MQRSNMPPAGASRRLRRHDSGKHNEVLLQGAHAISQLKRIVGVGYDTARIWYVEHGLLGDIAGVRAAAACGEISLTEKQRAG